MFRIYLFCVAVSALLLGGCADISSSDIRTSGICADIDIYNSNNKVKIDTRLTAGCGLGGSYVVLDSGDYLSANYLSHNYTLSQHTEFLSNITSYSASSSSNYSESEQITVALNRNSDSVSARNSFVNLPQTFSLTQPVNNAVYATGSTINFSWDRPHPSSRVSLNVSCNHSDGSTSSGSMYRTSSATSHQISVLEVYNNFFQPGGPALISCSGRANVKQSQTGHIDPAYKSGSKITASYIQSRNIGINF